MSDLSRQSMPNDPTQSREDNAISPLPGEAGIPDLAARSRISISKKGLLAIALLTILLVAVIAFTIHRFSISGRSEDADSKLTRDKPTAASADPRRLEVTFAAPSASTPRIPALIPTREELREPIGVRNTGPSAPKPSAPEDAPMLLVSSRPSAPARTPASTTTPGTREAPDEPHAAADGPASNDPMAATTRNLQVYQRQLQGLLETMTKGATLASGQALGKPTSLLPSSPSTAANVPGLAPAAGSGLFGGQLQGSATQLGNRSLTLPKGTAFTCALKTRIISATSGLVGCQVQRHVYSDDGRVLLIERGSHLDGEYRIGSVRPGTVRIPVLWTRIRTPQGVTADIESPGTGPLGEGGIDGHVDNRWFERIGAAMLLSLIDDSVKVLIQNQAHPIDSGQGDTIVLPSTTANASKLAEKVLDSTINIPPLIYQNQGGIVGIYVARDVDFSSVYELRPAGRDVARAPTHAVPRDNPTPPGIDEPAAIR